MKFLKRLWQKLSLLDKLSIAIAAAFTIFSTGHFLASNAGYLCPLCKQELEPGKDYLWDARTGETLELAPYVEATGDTMWFSEWYGLPQEASAARRCAYASFPDNPTGIVSYCPEHRALCAGPQEFYILCEQEAFTICYAIPDEGTVTPGGQTIQKHHNGGLETWELIIRW